MQARALADRQRAEVRRAAARWRRRRWPRARATRDRRRRAPASARRRARRASAHEASESVPSATRSPAARMPPTGGRRAPMCRFERGQRTAMQPWRAARSSESESATVRCTSSVPGPSTPSESSQAIGRTPGTATDGSASRSARKLGERAGAVDEPGRLGRIFLDVDRRQPPAVARRQRAQRRWAAAVGGVRRLARRARRRPARRAARCARAARALRCRRRRTAARCRRRSRCRRRRRCRAPPSACAAARATSTLVGVRVASRRRTQGTRPSPPGTRTCDSSRCVCALTSAGHEHAAMLDDLAELARSAARAPTAATRSPSSATAPSRDRRRGDRARPTARRGRS